jgi:carboxyl-terminal processing protease
LRVTKPRGVLHRVSTPAIVVGSLVAALGLTAVGDTEAQANRGDPRDHAGLGAQSDVAELRVLDWALWNVSKYYVEPNRIDPTRITVAGIEALESTIPEVLVEPLADGRRIRVRVGTYEREFDTDVQALWTAGPHIREVFRFVDEHADLDLEEQREAEYAIVEAVLGTLDPHTNLLRPDDFEDMKASTKGSFGGLGIEVGMREGAITVIRVLDGNPAQKVGILPGDRIVQIEQESTVTMDINEAVARLRGAPGTTVTIYVRRETLDKPRRFEITRDIITLDSVVADIVPGVDAEGRPVKVGVVQIPRNFAQTTGKELRDKLDGFREAGVVGVVLDMRDNPGGLLNAAVEVADAFLSRGTIVSTVGAHSARDESEADDRYDFPNLPLVVLVDQGSASATEIVAGALRNLDRAVIMGRRTFGKGSVQVLHDRRVGDEELALKLTIAQYLTPGDVSIQSVGVSPDIETIPVWIGREYTYYFGRKRFDLVREESLEAHLRHGTARQQDIAAGPIHFLQQGSVGEEVAEAARLETIEDADKRAELLLRDAEIRMARDLVVRAQGANRQEMLAQLEAFATEQSRFEGERITRSLSHRGIDWTAGTAPSAGTAAELRLVLKTDKKDNAIRGGETGTLTATVTNVGSAPAWQVRAISDSDYGYFDERELFFGRIDPGQTRTATLQLSVGEHELTRTDRLAFSLFEQHGAPMSKDSHRFIDVSAQSLTRPEFAFAWQILDEPRLGGEIQGNGDGALQVGERVRLRVDVSNAGTGPALDTWVHLRNGSGDAVFLHSGREQLGELRAGATRTTDLELEIRHATPEGSIELQLSAADNKLGEVLSDELVLAVHDASSGFAGGPAAVSTRTAVDLLASPLLPGHVVGRAEAATSFRALGVRDGWVKLDLGDGRFAFAPEDEVEPGRAGRKPGRFVPVSTVSPPRIELVGAVTQTERESIHLSGIATDSEAVRDVFVTVRNPSRNLFGREEKVFYQAAKDPSTGRLEFAADVPLTPGNNLIEVHVRENDAVVGTRRLWVLRTSGLAEARMAQRRHRSDGKLSVDTLR